MSLFSRGMLGRYLRNAFAVKRGDEPFGDPLVVTYEITHRPDATTDELSTADAKKLLDVIGGVCDAVSVVGGEPLLREDLEDVLAHAKALGMRVGLTTSARVVERPRVLELVDEVKVTLDDVKGDLTGIESLARVSKQKGLSMHVRCTIRPGSLQDVRDVLAWCRAHNVSFVPEPEMAGIWPSPALKDSAEYRALIDEIIAAKWRGARIASSLGFIEGVREFRKFTCHPGLKPRVRPTGELYYPCAPLQKIAGNVVQEGDWHRTMAQGRAKHGPVPDCGNHCHFRCTMDVSLVVREPRHALEEGLFAVRRALGLSRP